MPLLEGFAIDVAGLRHIMSRVAADGRDEFKNRIPSEDVIRLFGAMHRDINIKKKDNKKNAKLREESYKLVE